MDTWDSVRKDTLERACDNCGTRYPAEDPACPQCFRPGGSRYSRWRGGPTSFSLPTKLAITGVLLGLAVTNAVFSFAAMGRYGWIRTIELGVILLLPVPFLFRRSRIR